MNNQCIECVINDRTGFDLQCDECREKKVKALTVAKDLIMSGWAGVNGKGTIVDRREFPTAIPIQANPLFGNTEPKNKCQWDDFGGGVEQ